MTAKTTQLRQLLEGDSLDFILEAHNGISARIVEEAGFKGIWASGLALSAQFGVRDNNERSEEHTSELQSRSDLVCRLLLEKKKNTKKPEA